MAAGIAESSGGQIKTGIYHADVGDKNKESLHKRWRQGQIQVVCATIGEIPNKLVVLWHGVEWFFFNF